MAPSHNICTGHRPSPPLPGDHPDDYDFSFAEIYTGLRPDFVPTAVALDDTNLFSYRMYLDHEQIGSTLPFPGTSNACPDHEQIGSTLPFPGTSNACPDQSHPEDSASLRFALSSNSSSNQAKDTPRSGTSSRFHSDDTEILPCIDENDHTSGCFTDVPSSERISSFASSSNMFSHDSEIRNGNIKDDSKKRKKGDCHRCLKGSRLQDKESCLVCNAKYCAACVIDVMGSMPEGRKCLRCLGKPVAESRLPSLGKPSKVLCRLLTAMEVQLIMKAERECPTNQLRAEQVWVNGKQLTQKEFVNLCRCDHPPSQLAPGKYWYDGSSGYWGKVGQKPSEIISCDLKFSGALHVKASNGSTKVYINEREITKIEMKMLQLAGIACSPGTRLWVRDKGECFTEGYDMMLGNIWSKGPIRLLSPLFSLPIPNDKTKQFQLLPTYLDKKKAYKILLLGHPDSGTDTILKQVRFLHGGPLTTKERQAFKLTIQSCIFKYMTILLEARERFCNAEAPSTSSASSSDANVYALEDRLKKEADRFLDNMATDRPEQTIPAAAHEYAKLLEEIWNDPAIQATYKRRNELLMLPDVAEYFLDKVVQILSNEYEPSDMDILFAETDAESPCISEIEFSQFDNYAVSGPYTESLVKPFRETRSSLISVTGDIMADGFRLFRMFENVDALIFCVALDSYDQVWSKRGTDLQNKMILCRDMFVKVIKHPNFQKIPIILFLDKLNSLEKKIECLPLNRCQWFSDFDPVRSSHQSLAENAYTYIAHKFKKHIEAVSGGSSRLFTFQIRTLEQSSVKDALQYVQEILKWQELKPIVCSRPVDSLYTTGSETNNASSS